MTAANAKPPLLNDLPDVFDFAALCSLLPAVSPTTLRAAVRAGQIPVIRVGRRTLFSRAAIGRWLAGEPTPAAPETYGPAGIRPARLIR
jgi:excisionase family DNA binding protein